MAVAEVELSASEPSPINASANRRVTVISDSILLEVSLPLRDINNQSILFILNVIGNGLIAIVFSINLALAGFQKPATWLIGFGLLMGEATRRSALAHWARIRITARIAPDAVGDRPLRTYRRLLIVLSIGAHVLAFLIPSPPVRILIIAPILNKISELFKDRRARVGLFLGLVFATFYGSTGAFTANLTNIMISGFSESIADHSISCTRWLFHRYPIMGLTRVALVCGVVYYLFRLGPASSFDRLASTPELVTSAGCWRFSL